MFIFACPELVGICIAVVFIIITMLLSVPVAGWVVVVVLVPTYAVYATDASLMETSMLAAIVLPGAMAVVVLLLISGMGAGVVAAAGVMTMEDWPAAPQRVLANARAAGPKKEKMGGLAMVNQQDENGNGGGGDGFEVQVWSLAEQPWAMAARREARTSALEQTHATSVIVQPDCWIATRPACCWLGMC